MIQTRPGNSLNIIDELSCVSQNVDHSLIVMNELPFPHLEIKVFINTHEYFDNKTVALFKALEGRVSTTNTCHRGKKKTYDDLRWDPHVNQISTG